jgi:hypothetical protein
VLNLLQNEQTFVVGDYLLLIPRAHALQNYSSVLQGLTVHSIHYLPGNAAALNWLLSRSRRDRSGNSKHEYEKKYSATHMSSSLDQSRRNLAL